MRKCRFCGRPFVPSNETGPDPIFCQRACVNRASNVRRAPVDTVIALRASEILSRLGAMLSEPGTDPRILRQIHQLAMTASDYATAGK